MHKKLMWNVPAAMVIELAMMTTLGYPQISAAKRAQAQQIEKKDVVLATTPGRGDRPVARTDDHVRKALNRPSFNGALQGQRFGEVKAGGLYPPWMCNSPIVDGAAIHPRMQNLSSPSH